ncbi:hypothetical protein [Sorangium sp. So ce1024]|uniref:hypothetical protein n=1 Tax=Sorangium sp. So ce1024 TaxID=3133327 RepID=UPI003F011CD8
MRVDVEIVQALGIGLSAASEVALRHGWDEETFVKLAGLVFRTERGKATASPRSGVGSVVRLPRSGNRNYRVAKGPNERGQYLFKEAEGHPHEFWARWEDLGPVEDPAG